MLTLSRAQLEQIEGGGSAAFYSPRHKLLAVRKYATAFGLDPAEIIGVQPLSPAEPEAGTGSFAESGPAASGNERNDTAVAASDDLRRDAPDPAPAPGLAFPRSRTPVGWILLALLLASVGVAFSIKRHWGDGFIGAAKPPRTETGFAVPPSVPQTAEPRATPVAMGKGDGPQGLQADCGASAVMQSPDDWTPAYVRRPGTRLYIRGPAGTEVCVLDSAGTVVRRVMSLDAIQAIDGRPPYVVHFPALDRLQMFMQGQRVRVPSQAKSIRLLPRERPPVHEASSGGELPES